MNQTWKVDSVSAGVSPVDKVCVFGAVPFHVISSLILACGVAGNIFIILYSIKQLKQNPTAYIVFLVSLSINNIVGIVISLPCFYLEFSTNILRTVSFQTANIICFTKLFFQFNCLGVGLCTLAVLCYDRYEVFKLCTQDKLFRTILRAKLTAVAIWIIITIMTFLSLIGSMITLVNGGGLCFAMRAPPFNIPTSYTSKITGYALIALTTTWITTCNSIFIVTLKKVHIQIRDHMANASSVLGAARVKIEINLYRIAIVTVLMYSLFWIPYGIARGVFTAYMFSVPGVACFYAMGSQLSYLVYGILPYIYILSDTDARKKFFGMFKRSNEVQG